MIKIQTKLPRSLTIACSGGVDSMAVVDFLKRKHDVSMLFVHHGTTTSQEAYGFLKSYSETTGIPLNVYYIDSVLPKGVSQEEHWRNERYKIFHRVDGPVITAHHLDDCVETWIWSSMHGMGKIIPYSNQNVIRPFRLTSKNEFAKWCTRNDVPWVEDNSNNDIKYMRNYIRHEVMPVVSVINPGIKKVIKKKVELDVQN
jgi:tRNA(Ile)-lysidine synthase